MKEKGAVTAALVAIRVDRSFSGYDVNADYADLARRRLIAATVPLKRAVA